MIDPKVILDEIEKQLRKVSGEAVIQRKVDAYTVMFSSRITTQDGRYSRLLDVVVSQKRGTVQMKFVSVIETDVPHNPEFLEFVNKLNLQYRFCKIYIEPDGKLKAEYDVILCKGDEENLRNNISLLIRIVAKVVNVFSEREYIRMNELDWTDDTLKMPWILVVPYKGK